MHNIFKVTILAICSVVIQQRAFSQEVSITPEAVVPFFALAKDLRIFNICVEDLGTKFEVYYDPILRYAAVASNAWKDTSEIRIGIGYLFTQASFKEKKHILLHEILHHKGHFHRDPILAMQAYIPNIPGFYEIGVAQAAIILAE